MHSAAYFVKNDPDSKDLAIMYQLDLNSRQSISAIAKKLAIDKAVVNYRISRLVERNFIQGFYALIDAPALGFEGFRVYLRLENTDETIEKEIIDFFTKSQLTWWVGSIDGIWNLGAVLWVKNIYQLKGLLTSFNLKYKKFVQNSLVCAYTTLYEFPLAFLPAKKITDRPMHIIGQSTGKQQISSTEEKILKVLAQNCRLPTVEIAKKTGLTPIQVKYAIAKMLKNRIIKGFRTMFNLEKLGLSYYKIDITLNETTKLSEFLSFARQNNRIIYVDESIGGADFEIEALVQNHSQVHEIMQEMRRKFPKTIKNYTYYIYSKIHKIIYF